MSHFTSKYNEITKLEGVPFSIRIHHDEHKRWICYSYKEQIGTNKYQFTLVDNHLESFTFIWNGPGTTEFVTCDGKYKGRNISILYANNDSYSGLPPDTITCITTIRDSLPLPDFLIEVLHTVQSNILFEVIRRAAVAFRTKIDLLEKCQQNHQFD